MPHFHFFCPRGSLCCFLSPPCWAPHGLKHCTIFWSAASAHPFPSHGQELVLVELREAPSVSLPLVAVLELAESSRWHSLCPQGQGKPCSRLHAPNRHQQQNRVFGPQDTWLHQQMEIPGRYQGLGQGWNWEEPALTVETLICYGLEVTLTTVWTASLATDGSQDATFISTAKRLPLFLFSVPCPGVWVLIPPCFGPLGGDEVRVIIGLH